MDLTLQGRRLEGLAAAGPSDAWLARLSGPARAESSVEADRWTMYRGNPARNAATRGSAPLMNLRWRVPVTDDDVAREALRQVGETTGTMAPCSSRRFIRWPSTTLSSRGLPTPCGRWTLPRASDYGTSDRRPDGDSGGPQPAGELPPGLALAGAPGRADLDDAAYGTLTSDGRRVFSLEDLTVGTANNPNMAWLSSDRRGIARRRAARIVQIAWPPIDIHTGKLQWELGGPAGPQAFARPTRSSSARRCRSAGNSTCWPRPR